MPITHEQLVAAVEQRHGFPLNGNQRAAILYGDGPLRIVAGPGTGKTEVLVVRCLKLLCCDEVLPRGVVLTTFTQKAATNLEDRLTDTLLYLVSLYPQLGAIDPSEVRVGTLHGLCNDILQEYRYTGYQNLRLLDEIESALFIHRRVVRVMTDGQKEALRGQFAYMFGNAPHLGRWDWALALRTLFDRLVEDRVDLAALATAEGPWAILAGLFSSYEVALAEDYSCDFAHLQQRFLAFLGSAQGARFLGGDETGLVPKPALSHVLVDEYQDTNPIQEQIYFRLCDQGTHNLTVVGDDDQALYRFRGGTVECMVGFDQVSQARWGELPQTTYLSENYRSDAAIVGFCNGYIATNPHMTGPQVRIPGKPAITPASGRAGEYPVVGLIRNSTIRACAQSLASLVRDLRENGVVADYRQCALLLRSAKATPGNAGPYLQGLGAAGIPVYNPRSRSFLEEDEVAQFMGAFVTVVDPGLAYTNALQSLRIRQMVLDWVTRYVTAAGTHDALRAYVLQAQQAVGNAAANARILPAFPTILYRVLAHEPFISYQADPVRDLRLSKITRLMEAFSAQYGRGLVADPTAAGRVHGSWLGGLFHGLFGYMERLGVDDDEDEEVVCPAGYFPVMTVHQAKGLEFDFVFVGNLGLSVSADGGHELEAALRPFRTAPPAVFHGVQDSAWHDAIRLHYVAYSRARYALVLVATDAQLRRTGQQTASFGAQGGPWVRQTVPRL